MRFNATVTLDLSVEQTMALAPPIDATGQQQRIDILGDVRLVHGTEVSYFGPSRSLSVYPEVRPIPAYPFYGGCRVS